MAHIIQMIDGKPPILLCDARTCPVSAQRREASPAAWHHRQPPDESGIPIAPRKLRRLAI
jgi:hypothetical protein